ncbi:MAG: hypothetical protein U9Q96_02765 [Patescibacteria group bacterium]|nr:hypothetical protein [Patescibacteria group bacterium]
MGLFTSRRTSSSSGSSESNSKGSGRNFFDRSRYGGKISSKGFGVKMRSMRLRPVEKEYVKSVMEKFDSHHSRGITKEEFLQGLDEMKANKRDNISDAEVEKLRKHFE